MFLAIAVILLTFFLVGCDDKDELKQLEEEENSILKCQVKYSPRIDYEHSIKAMTTYNANKGNHHFHIWYSTEKWVCVAYESYYDNNTDTWLCTATIHYNIEDLETNTYLWTCKFTECYETEDCSYNIYVDKLKELWIKKEDN